MALRFTHHSLTLTLPSLPAQYDSGDHSHITTVVTIVTNQLCWHTDTVAYAIVFLGLVKLGKFAHSVGILKHSKWILNTTGDADNLNIQDSLNPRPSPNRETGPLS